MKFKFIRTQPGPFIYVPSRVAFVLFTTDLMTHNIYYLAQDRKILLTPILKDNSLPVFGIMTIFPQPLFFCQLNLRGFFLNKIVLTKSFLTLNVDVVKVIADFFF